MEISYLGHSSFKLRSKHATVVVDPFNPDFVGFKFPKTEADVVLVSHDHEDHNFASGVEGTPIIISGPGEYEVKGVKITGVSVYHDTEKGNQRGKNTVYRINMDGITIVHCGDLGHKFDDKELEELSGANILMVPVGGLYTIDAGIAAEVVSQIDPDIIIPMHYATKNLKPQIAEKLSGVEIFLKQMGKEGIIPVAKLSITKDKLPPEPMVVVLE